MPILVSFVNQFYSPELSLGLYDDADGSFAWVLPEGRPMVAEGASGIAACGENIYVCYQRAGLIVYDRSFGVRQVFEFERIKDPHTCLVHDGALYVVSSGTDEIYRLQLDSTGLVTDEMPFWRYHASTVEGTDEYHVNSFAVTPGGRMLATCFGKKVGTGWVLAVDGKLMDIASGEVIMDGLRNPHSVFCLGDDVLVCESLTSRVVSVKGRSVELGGYLRGACETDGHVVVASSARRRWSKSQKKVVNINDSPSENENSSLLYFLDKKSLGIARRVDLTTYGREIFDLAWISPGTLNTARARGKAAVMRVNAMEDALIAYAGEVGRLEAEVGRLNARIASLDGGFAGACGRAVRGLRAPVARPLSWLRSLLAGRRGGMS